MYFDLVFNIFPIENSFRQYLDSHMTYSKILKKITEKAKNSLETIATFDFRSENAIRFLENVFTQNSLDSIFWNLRLEIMTK